MTGPGGLGTGVERYALNWHDLAYADLASMDTDPSGDYVRYIDYARLETDRDLLERTLSEMPIQQGSVALWMATAERYKSALETEKNRKPEDVIISYQLGDGVIVGMTARELVTEIVRLEAECARLRGKIEEVRHMVAPDMVPESDGPPIMFTDVLAILDRA